jgi:23S rRNA (guanosine2251-2'-O)-methyltransferase
MSETAIVDATRSPLGVKRCARRIIARGGQVTTRRCGTLRRRSVRQDRRRMSEERHLSGFHAVIARLRASAGSVRSIYVAASRQDRRMRDLVDRARAAGVAVHSADAGRLAALAGDDRHQGVVAIVDATVIARTLDEVLDGLAEPALLLVLDGVTDPHNLGACLRSADVFGVHAVVVPKDRAVGVNATVAKAASGAADTVPLISVTNLSRTLRELKERGVWILGADVDGENLFDADVSGPIAWVLGAEGSGLRRLTRESCDRIVTIPMSGAVESLNVSVTAGVCLFATRRQRASASAARR